MHEADIDGVCNSNNTITGRQLSDGSCISDELIASSNSVTPTPSRKMTSTIHLPELRSRTKSLLEPSTLSVV